MKFNYERCLKYALEHFDDFRFIEYFIDVCRIKDESPEETKI